MAEAMAAMWWGREGGRGEGGGGKGEDSVEELEYRDRDTATRPALPAPDGRGYKQSAGGHWHTQTFSVIRVLKHWGLPDTLHFWRRGYRAQHCINNNINITGFAIINECE